MSVGVTRSVAVDEVNGFVYFGLYGGNITQVTLNGGSITQVTLDGSSTKHIFSTGKLNLHDCSRVVMGYHIILHTISLLIHEPITHCSLLSSFILLKCQCSL